MPGKGLVSRIYIKFLKLKKKKSNLKIGNRYYQTPHQRTQTGGKLTYEDMIKIKCH